MNRILIKAINKIEKHNSVNDNLIRENRKIRKYFLGFKNYLNRIASFTRVPKYYLSKKNISDSVKIAQKEIELRNYVFNENDQYNKELNKVLIRIDLRYKYSQQLLLSRFINNILEDTNSYFDFKQFKWTSLFYPIIHLPNDFSEEGSIHSDYSNLGFNGARIAWLPFTDYSYPGIIKKSNFLSLISHFSPRSFGLKILKNAKEFPLKNKHLKGSWMAWNDTFFHKGILNNSKDISAALIIRFSNKLDNQTFLPLDKLSSEHMGLFFNENEFEHNQLVNSSKKIVNDLIENARYIKKTEYQNSKLEEYIGKGEADTFEYCPKELLCIFHIVEYALDLFIQRVNNTSINWIDDEKSNSIDNILINLKKAKKLVNKKIVDLT